MMLFTKKVKFYVSEKQLKEELVSSEGITILKINLRYPHIVCAKNDPLMKNAVPLYTNLPCEFANYAKTELYNSAMKAFTASPQTFAPYSAVMQWEKTFENHEFLSVILDISVSDGINPTFTERKTQIWDRKTGLKCPLSRILPGDKREMVAKGCFSEYKNKIPSDLFVLRQDGAEFFISSAEGFKSVFVPNSYFV